MELFPTPSTVTQEKNSTDIFCFRPRPPSSLNCCGFRLLWLELTVADDLRNTMVVSTLRERVSPGHSDVKALDKSLAKQKHTSAIFIPSNSVAESVCSNSNSVDFGSVMGLRKKTSNKGQNPLKLDRSSKRKETPKRERRIKSSRDNNYISSKEMSPSRMRHDNTERNSSRAHSNKKRSVHLQPIQEARQDPTYNDAGFYSCLRQPRYTKVANDEGTIATEVEPSFFTEAYDLCCAFPAGFIGLVEKQKTDTSTKRRDFTEPAKEARENRNSSTRRSRRDHSSDGRE